MATGTTNIKKDNLYYCFRYKCKNCPKQKQCEKEGDTIERRKSNTYERTKQE